MGIITREKDAFDKMITLYCQAKHGTKADICEDCQEVLIYSKQRVEGCQFGEKKPICYRCPVHCFRKDMLAKIKKTMRYAGPRMLYKYPGIAICHLIDALKKPPK